MAEKDKYADELMSDEELDGVAGGTVQEYRELRGLFDPEIIVVRNKLGGEYEEEIYKSDDDIRSWLKYNLNIEATFNYKRWFPWQDGDPNVYTRNGESVSHAQVIKEAKAKLGK